MNDPCLLRKDPTAWISTCFWTWPSLPLTPALPRPPTDNSCLSSHPPHKQCLGWHDLVSILRLGNYHLPPIKTQFKCTASGGVSDMVREDI